MDFILDYTILKLSANKIYQEYMHEMLKQNKTYVFPTVNNYHHFQEELFLSLGGNLKYKQDYETIVLMLLCVSNKHGWSALKLVPQFVKSIFIVRWNGLSVMKNTMHMLSLHATSIGGYLSQSYNEEFISILKKVRIVRENTGYIKGKKILFTRVTNPFLGSRQCPLASCYLQLNFPPLADQHDFLNLKNFGNALGVIGTNNKEHLLDNKPLNDYAFMKDSEYWKRLFFIKK